MALNKIIAASSVALLASISDAKPFDESCLLLSDQTAGQQSGTKFDQVEILTGENISDDMRITSIEVCSDPSGIKSIDVTLSNDEDTWVMDTIGGKTSDCRVIETVPRI